MSMLSLYLYYLPNNAHIYGHYLDSNNCLKCLSSKFALGSKKIGYKVSSETFTKSAFSHQTGNFIIRLCIQPVQRAYVVPELLRLCFPIDFVPPALVEQVKGLAHVILYFSSKRDHFLLKTQTFFTLPFKETNAIY